MHKRLAIGAIICLNFCATLLFASPSHAAVSGSVAIVEVLTGTTQSASAEFIELYNQTSSDISVEGWKIQYFSATGSTSNLRATLHGTLKSHGSLLASTTEFGGAADAILGAGMPEAGGRLRLVNEAGIVIDGLSWGSGTTSSEGMPATAPQRGQSLIRTAQADNKWIDTDNNATDFVISLAPVADGGGVYEPVDVCPNLPDEQSEMPPGYQLNEGGECVSLPPIIEYPIIQLSEVLPDPGSPKTDANDEFIELYNPNEIAVDVAGYKIISGSNLSSVYTLPNYSIPAHGFLTLYASETKISLANSGSKLQLQSPDGKAIGDVLQYEAAGTDQTWAYFHDGWKLTDKATPNNINELVIETEEPGMGSSETATVPCPAGKYRNPLTNRCRNIESDASVLAACNDGEYRSPETNRCRNASLATAAITPCQEGYTRNPDTNRCRKVAAETGSIKPCDPGQERNPETNRCRKIAAASTSAITDPPVKQGLDAMGGVVLGIVGLVAVGYGAFEWRNEIVMAFGRLLAALGKK